MANKRICISKETWRLQEELEFRNNVLVARLSFIVSNCMCEVTALDVRLVGS